MLFCKWFACIMDCFNHNFLCLSGFLGCGTSFQPFGLCFKIFVEFLIKAPTNVFTTSKDLVDPECMEFSRCRLVQEISCIILTVFFVNGHAYSF